VDGEGRVSALFVRGDSGAAGAVVVAAGGDGSSLGGVALADVAWSAAAAGGSPWPEPVLTATAATAALPTRTKAMPRQISWTLPILFRRWAADGWCG
jgi:hypothetical protein